MNRLALADMLRTIWHTRPKQLLWRIRYTLERMASRVAFVRAWRKKRLTRRKITEPVSNVSAFTGRLPRRTGELRWSDNRLSIRFLNQERTFSNEIDWHIRDFPFGWHSWLFHLHYLEWLETAGNNVFERVVDSWMANNPIDAKRHWLYSWHSYVLSVRVVFLIQQTSSRWTSLDRGFRDRLLRSLYLQMRYLYRHIEYDLVGNHLLKNIKALLWSGAFFVGEEADRWSRLGHKLLRKELIDQFLTDGAHYERSPAYHLQVLADMLECRQVTGDDDMLRRLDDCISKAMAFADDMHHPDGLPSLFNDGMLHGPITIDKCRKVWHGWTGATPETKPVFSYPDAGYFGAAKGGDLIIVDCGKMSPDFLPAHAHADILSFEWTLDGHRIVVDPGTFSYDPGDRRNLDRATPRHNTVSVDGASQTRFWGSHRMGRRIHPRVLSLGIDPDAFVIEGEHGGFRHLRGKPVHRRRFSAAPNRIFVEDTVIDGDGQRVESSVLFHPDCRIEPIDSGYAISCANGRAQLLFDGESRLIEAVWSPDFGVEEACTRIVLTYGRAPCGGNFALEKL